jgi:hypothetical protein
MALTGTKCSMLAFRFGSTGMIWRRRNILGERANSAQKESPSRRAVEALLKLHFFFFGLLAFLFYVVPYREADHHGP